MHPLSSRRLFLKRILAAGGEAFPASGLLPGCPSHGILWILRPKQALRPASCPRPFHAVCLAADIRRGAFQGPDRWARAGGLSVPGEGARGPVETLPRAAASADPTQHGAPSFLKCVQRCGDY